MCCCTASREKIGFVADPADDPGNWYVTEYGGGVMVIEPKIFGYEDFEFVSRAEV